MPANIKFMSAGGPTGAMPAFNCQPLLPGEDVTTGNRSTPAPVDCYVRVYTDVSMRVAFGGASVTAASTDMQVSGEFTGFVPAGTYVAVVDG